MKKILLTFLLFNSVFGFAQTTIIDSIFVGGIYRNYRLYFPAVYNGSSARPLVLNLHGYTSNAYQQQFYSNFMPIADTANFLMVLPNGTFNGSAQFWNAGISAGAVDDVTFISQLIDSLDLNYNIDLDRVYSTGMSNGGFMSHTLACELSGKIAAIASVTGSIFLTQAGANCAPTHPMPVMQIHGTNDGTVPYIGNATMLSINDVVAYWTNYNNCNSTPTITAIPNTSIVDGCTAERYVYSNGTRGSTVELYKITGGSHSWPGTLFATTGTNLDMNASKEIWRFFSPYRLNTLVSITDIEKEKIGLELFPNPSSTIIQIQFKGEAPTKYKVRVKTLLGETTNEFSNITEVDIADLTAGVYFIEIETENSSVTRKFIKE